MFVSIPARLGIDSRILGDWLTRRTSIDGFVVSLDRSGSGQFLYAGTVEWWIELGRPAVLLLAEQRLAVNPRRIASRDYFIVVDFELAGTSDQPPDLTVEISDEYERVERALHAYWKSPAGGRQVSATKGTQAMVPSDDKQGGYMVDQDSRAMLDAVAVPLLLLGFDGTCILVNRAATELLGRGRSELENTRTSAFACEQLTSQLPDRSGATPGTTLEQVEAMLLRADGEAVDVIVDRAVVEWPGLGPVVVASCVDVSAVRDAEEVARQAAETERRFLSNMSHELRTPLNAVIGLAGLLSAELTDDGQRELAEMIHDAGEQLLGAVDQLLSLNALDAQSVELDSTTFTLPELVETVIRPFNDAAVIKGVLLQTTIDPELPSLWEGSKTVLAGAIARLVDNAIKFTDEGSVDLLITGSGSESDEPTWDLQFVVRDTGVGIPRPLQQAVFREFHQVDNGLTRAHNGLGVGLTVASRLVQLVGGTISCMSSGGGSTFTVSAQLRKAPCRSADAGSDDLKGLNVLVVDDSNVNRLITGSFVKGWGGHYLGLGDPTEALELVGSGHRWDAAILDYRMPKMNGGELAHLLSVLVPQMPRILLTSMDLDAVDTSVFDATLSQPVRPDALLQVLRRATGADAPTALSSGTPALEAGAPDPS